MTDKKEEKKEKEKKEKEEKKKEIVTDRTDGTTSKAL